MEPPFFSFIQEDFRSGRQLLYVERADGPVWEVWDWGPHTVSEELDERMGRYLGLTRREMYERVVAQAKLLQRTSDWSSVCL